MLVIYFLPYICRSTVFWHFSKLQPLSTNMMLFVFSPRVYMLAYRLVIARNPFNLSGEGTLISLSINKQNYCWESYTFQALTGHIWSADLEFDTCGIENSPFIFSFVLDICLCIYLSFSLLYEQMVENALNRKPGGENILEEYRAENSLSHRSRRQLVNILASDMTERYG